jgi:hypothetical protein
MFLFSSLPVYTLFLQLLHERRNLIIYLFIYIENHNSSLRGLPETLSTNSGIVSLIWL